MSQRIDGRLVLLALIVLVAAAGLLAMLAGSRDHGSEMAESSTSHLAEDPIVRRQRTPALPVARSDEETARDAADQDTGEFVHVSVVDGVGAGIDHVRVRVIARGIAVEALTDGSGQSVLPFGGPGVLIAEPPRGSAVVREVREPGSVRVVVPATAPTAFQVLVDGDIPPGPLEIGLRIDPRGRSSVRRRLEARAGIDLSRRPITTDATGRFSWDWQPGDALSFSLPPGIWPEEGGNVIHLPARAVVGGPVILRAVVGRAIRGVCRLEDGTPALEARVRVSSPAFGGVSEVDDDGNFQVALPPAAPDEVDVKIVARAQGVSVERDLVTHSTGASDAGTFIFPKGSRHVVRVVDSAGLPVAGALLSVDDEESVVPTGRDGQAVVEGIGPQERHLFVCAPGFASLAVEIDRLSAETTIRLDRGTHIEIAVLEAPTNDPYHSLHIESDHGLRDVAQRAPAAWCELNGIDSDEAQWQMSRSFTLFRDPGENVNLYDVPAGAIVTVRALPVIGRPAGTSHVVADTTEVQMIAFTPSVRKSLHGRVIDETGRPVPHATVHVTPPGWGFGPGFPVDEHGVFVIGDLCVDSARLDVHAGGHAWNDLGEVALARDVTEIEVTLRRGVTGTLHVVNSAGRLVDADVRLVRPVHRGPSHEVRRLEAGRFELLDLPSGPIQLHVSVGIEGRHVECFLSDASDLVVEAPPTGELIVEDLSHGEGSSPKWIVVARDGVVVHCAVGVPRTAVRAAPGRYGVGKRDARVTRGQEVTGDLELVDVRLDESIHVVLE